MSLIMRSLPSSSYREGISHTGGLSSAFRKKKEGQRALFALVSQVLLIQNNQHDKVAYFGVTCSELLHLSYSSLQNDDFLICLSFLHLLDDILL